MADPQTETGNTQDSVVPGSKKILKNKPFIDGACQRDTGTIVNELPVAKPGTI